MLRAVAAAGAYVQAVSSSGTPLHWAAGQGQTAAVVALVDAGADVDALDADGLTALLLAAVASAQDAAVQLIQAGADIQPSLPGGLTALHDSTPDAAQLNRALADANVAMTLAPHDPAGHQVAGQVSLALGRFQDAAVALWEALRWAEDEDCSALQELLQQAVQGGRQQLGLEALAWSSNLLAVNHVR
ncbi:hypothetical protein WJX72_003824 [[Myrmecia] bisecta]|uniref:Uncharacterized protein n=1 Tax=[Myrmecia] bisecta TaxID=41462 RepID=A0AAW1QFB4_9CHLO